MLGLNFGELFLVTFITVAVVSARYWPLLGARLALLLAGHSSREDDRPSAPPNGSGPPAS